MKNLQQKVKQFQRKFGLENDLYIAALDIVGELGEVSSAILKSTNYGREDITSAEKVNEEIGDLFYSLITLANCLDLDLTKQLEKTIDKYEKRITEKSHPGSEI